MPMYIKKLLIAFMVLLCSSIAFALDQAHKDAWVNELRYLQMKTIPYVWGGADYTGADCSGIVYASAKKAGLDVRRVTALEMFRGLGGWKGIDILSILKAQNCDLMFFTDPNARLRRPMGHVGLVFFDKDGEPFKVFNASSTAHKLIVAPYTGWLKENTTGLRRLTIGD